MSEIASHTTVPAAERPHRTGVPWFVFMVGMWLTFAALAIGSADTLDGIWSWARGLPLLVEGVVWLLLFPWMLGLAVWESSWEDWLRVLLVSCVAAGWTLVSVPRSTGR